MRTTLDIDEKLIDDILRITGEKQKSKAVTKVLEEFRRRVAIEELRAMAGKFDFKDRLEEQHEADLKRQKYLEELWSQGDNGNR